MDHRGQQMYQNPRMSMMEQSYIGSVPGSIPINNPMGNNAQETMGMPGATMSDNYDTFTHKTHLNKLPVQQNYSQLPLRKEVDDEGRICGVVLPETPAQLPKEEDHSRLEEVSQEEIKTEEEDISYFMESAHDIFLKISSKELTIKAAADILGRPYSFVYSRYQEFCDSVTGTVEPKKKKKAAIIKKNGKKKKRAKKMNWGNNRNRSSSGNDFKCDICPAILHSEYMVKAHAKVHEEDNESHTCTACGVVFAKIYQLMQHRIEVHEEALQCAHCDSQFTIISSYRLHIKSHTEAAPYVCKECGKGYFAKLHLEYHIRKHTGERPFMCGYCEKTFMTLHNLKGHVGNVHTEVSEELDENGEPKQRMKKEKKFECEQCGRKYESNSALVQHMNIHTGAMPFACDLCDARFNFKTGLNHHKLTHTGVQPYKCDLCPAAFYKKIGLEQHKVVHTGVKPFKCDLCDYTCTRKHTLDYHKYTHTGETPFKCDFYGCTAEYAKPGSLRHHKLQHGQPPKTCNVCHEKFADLITLKRHKMIHTGEKPVSCEQCSKIFYEKSSLKRHMYSHMYKPPGSKTKQVRQSRKNPIVKKTDNSGDIQKKWDSEYQVPAAAENGLGIFAPSLTATVQNTNNQPSYHHFTASQYSSMVNNAWPSAMDADELRHRLLSSFK